MPDHEFVFALELSDDQESSRMLGEVCAAVMGHVGYGSAAVAETTTALRVEIGHHGLTGAGRCDVRFVVDSGELRIAVIRPGAAEWHTARPLPTP